MQFVRQPRLKDKVAIVTGAGSRGPGTGNGKAAAILFAREGAKVLLVDLCPERAEETMDIIEKENIHSLFIPSKYLFQVCKLATSLLFHN